MIFFFMVRKPRIEYEGAFYHVIIRGNQRKKIFVDGDDFLRYLEILKKYKKRYNYSLFSYIFMSNHVHLLIMTHETPLSKIVQGINQSYTMYFNRKYHKMGHLFQGRYKAILCDWDGYLLSLLKYIHCNPLMSGSTGSGFWDTILTVRYRTTASYRSRGRSGEERPSRDFLSDC